MRQNRGRAAVGHGIGKVQIAERIYENSLPGFGNLCVAAHVIRVRA